jgi:hypothetical protein
VKCGNENHRRGGESGREPVNSAVPSAMGLVSLQGFHRSSDEKSRSAQSFVLPVFVDSDFNITSERKADSNS